MKKQHEKRTHAAVTTRNFFILQKLLTSISSIYLRLAVFMFMYESGMIEEKPRKNRVNRVRTRKTKHIFVIVHFILMKSTYISYTHIVFG